MYKLKCNKKVLLLIFLPCFCYRFESSGNKQHGRNPRYPYRSDIFVFRKNMFQKRCTYMSLCLMLRDVVMFLCYQGSCCNNFAKARWLRIVGQRSSCTLSLSSFKPTQHIPQQPVGFIRHTSCSWVERKRGWCNLQYLVFFPKNKILTHFGYVPRCMATIAKYFLYAKKFYMR